MAKINYSAAEVNERLAYIDKYKDYALLPTVTIPYRPEGNTYAVFGKLFAMSSNQLCQFLVGNITNLGSHYGGLYLVEVHKSNSATNPTVYMRVGALRTSAINSSLKFGYYKQSGNVYVGVFIPQTYPTSMTATLIGGNLNNLGSVYDVGDYNHGQTQPDGWTEVAIS